MIDSIDHVNLVVLDMARACRFYEQVLGFRRSKHATISGEWIDATVGLSGVVAEIVYLELGQGPRIELARYEKPSPVEPIPGLLPANVPGLRHVAFRVRGIESLTERLRAAGVEVLSAVQTVPSGQVAYENGSRKYLVYFRDPEGNLLELCEYR